ncbi:MAG: hypothetical protein HY952_09830 [Elusimicrobia bacterium]|nr:hypothetical protein [Elusimicrobiota bacterium]
MSYKSFLPLLLLPALCACAASRLDIIQVGPWFPARDWRAVEVFEDRNQTTRPWGGIAIIHGERFNPEAGQREQERQKLQARKAAAAMGADGVIMTVDSAIAGPALGVYQEPEVFVSALAIKYVVPSSTPSAK